MDDDSLMASAKAKGEATNKVREGYTQLAEKMEQVRSQMARMERKYDELYQTVKEKETGRSASLGSGSESKADNSRSQRESVVSASSLSKQAPEEEPSPPKPPEKTTEESSPSKGGDLDIEKMEDNPFL